MTNTTIHDVVKIELGKITRHEAPRAFYTRDVLVSEGSLKGSKKVHELTLFGRTRNSLKIEISETKQV